MANSSVPDQSEEFKRSGKRLITDPAADVLLAKAKKPVDKLAQGGCLKDET